MEAEISRVKKRLQEELERTRALETWVRNISHSFAWRLIERFDHLWERRSAPEAPEQLPTPEPYDLWVARHALTPEKIRQLREEAQTLPYQPKISIVMPVYNTAETWLRRAIESVRSQIYLHWELCICDDGSTARHVSQVITEYSREDARIRGLMSPQNRGVSAASNGALSLATGEYVGFLDHDDELTPDALCEVVKLLNEMPDLDLIYTDEDKMTLEGRRVEHFFKPDWSPDLLLSMNYITHFAVVRRGLVQEIGGFTEGLEGSQDYDLFLRISEKTGRIGHVAKPLYSWRIIPGSAAGNIQAKPYANVAGRQALEEHLRRRGIVGKVSDGLISPCRYRVRYDISAQPLISIIIPTRDKVELLTRCLESIEAKTTYRHFEIIVLDNHSEEPDTLTYLAGLPHTVVPVPGPFNYSYLNNLGAARARGEFLLFLNNDIEVITEEWLEALLEHAQRKEVGAVGAKLIFPNGTIQHAGVIIGHGGFANNAFWGEPAANPGYCCLTHVVRNCSAVTGACMMTRKVVFDEVGGFDENLTVAFGDVDLCLRMRERGYTVVYTPYAVLYHLESATREGLHPMADEAHARQRWGWLLVQGDPYYNPHLTLERFDSSLRILDTSVRREQVDTPA